MAMIMGGLYDALVDGGTQPDLARKAAEEIADYRKQLADIRTDLAFIKGVLGITVTGVFALVVKTFFV